MKLLHPVVSISYILIFFISTNFCKKMNVILLVLDDLRPLLGCFGVKNAYTPNIDQLAKDSILFSNAFAQQALCAPSRNSFLTSRRPDTLKLYDFYSYWREVAGNFTTLPQFFKENSYATMSIGKVFHPGVSSNYSDDQPYSWTFPPFHPKTEIYKNSKVCITKGNPFLQSNLVCPVEPELQPGGTLPDIESTYEAIQFLRRAHTSVPPFFLAVGFHKPHIPLKYPKQFKKFHPLHNVVLPSQRRKPPGLPTVAWNPWTDLREREDIKELNIKFPFGIIKDKQAKLIIQSYYAAVSYIDDLIGQILKEVTRLQLDKTTVITLIGDHGWSLGEHGEWSKYSNFDVATRVPLILKIPGLSDRHMNDLKTVHEPVELVDLFPTLVDITGLQSISPCDRKSKTTKLCTEGKSLLPLIMNSLNNRSKKANREDHLSFSQYPRPGEYPTLKPNSDKPKLKEIKIMGCSIRTERFRYTEWCGFHNFSVNWNDIKASELYDHYSDSMENNNLSEDRSYIEIRKKLSDKLRLHWNTKYKIYAY